MLNAVTIPIRYLSDVRAELTRVVWPTREEVIRLTITVIILSVIIGSFLGGLDYLFTSLTAYLLK